MIVCYKITTSCIYSKTNKDCSNRVCCKITASCIYSKTNNDCSNRVCCKITASCVYSKTNNDCSNRVCCKITASCIYSKTNSDCSKYCSNWTLSRKLLFQTIIGTEQCLNVLIHNELQIQNLIVLNHITTVCDNALSKLCGNNVLVQPAWLSTQRIWQGCVEGVLYTTKWHESKMKDFLLTEWIDNGNFYLNCALMNYLLHYGMHEKYSESIYLILDRRK